MQKVLVTGGLGYIGSHTVVELENAGYEAVVVDNLSNTELETTERIHALLAKETIFYELDINDTGKLSQVFNEHKISAVIHFAAAKAVGESVTNPLKYYKNNVAGTVCLLERMKQYSVNNLIFSSSCTVYGQPDDLPVREDTPVIPAESPYGNTKQVCEEVIRDTVMSDPSFNAISLRYFNPIGAHESGLIGERPQGMPNNLLPYLLKVAAGELEQLSVFGGDYDTPDGSCIRDYIHVVDLAKAHVIALDRLINKKNKAGYEIFNLGTGQGSSVLEIIETFEEVTGERVNFQIVDRRPGDVEKIYSNTDLANNELGWRAELDLADMLRSAWKWQQTLNNKTI
ncbi:MAG: UDP-glucose 4-epimerase GalE [Ekhidna sp.]|nr:UDP-glucose 4-epimerase GalE [Ekhidna sp.]MBC6426090.1 UDP-glucose 4-epimerase GalE [Ekhidna sp.]